MLWLTYLGGIIKEETAGALYGTYVKVVCSTQERVAVGRRNHNDEVTVGSWRLMSH